MGFRLVFIARVHPVPGPLIGVIEHRFVCPGGQLTDLVELDIQVFCNPFLIQWDPLIHMDQHAVILPLDRCKGARKVRPPDIVRDISPPPIGLDGPTAVPIPDSQVDDIRILNLLIHIEHLLSDPYYNRREGPCQWNVHPNRVVWPGKNVLQQAR